METINMKKMSKKNYAVALVVILIAIIVAAIGVDGWQARFISSFRIRQIACLTTIREYLLENSLLIKKSDGSMTINTKSAPLESVSDIPFFHRQNYTLSPIDSITKPSKDKIVLIYNSGYLNSSDDWIAITVGEKANFVLYKDGNILAVDNPDEYVNQCANLVFYTYGKTK